MYTIAALCTRCGAQCPPASARAPLARASTATRTANHAVSTAKMTTHAVFDNVVRLAASIPAIAMPISRCATSVSRSTEPRCHGRATTSRAALTAATTSMRAAKMSRIQLGVIRPPSLLRWRTRPSRLPPVTGQ